MFKDFGTGTFRTPCFWSVGTRGYSSGHKGRSESQVFFLDNDYRTQRVADLVRIVSVLSAWYTEECIRNKSKNYKQDNKKVIK